LRIFAPKLRLALDAELRQDAEPVTGQAESRLRARAETTSAGSHYALRRKRDCLVLYSRTRGSAIAEFAGNVHPQGLTPRGAILIATLNERYGEPGRLLWEAWDSHSEAVMTGVKATVASFERALQRVIDGGAGA
jgi:hypothetical protein